jgi:hypothetical protein
MALSQVAPAPISGRAQRLRLRTGPNLVAAGWAVAITVLIAGPWLVQPGFMFGTDFPGPERFDWPSSISSSVPVQAALFVVSWVISAQAAGKLLYLAVVFLAALTAYRALPLGGFIARAAASAIYVFNPFVFGRLHYGQLFLLAGYAVLPWVASRLLELCRRPTWRAGAVLGIGLALLGVFTAHLFFVAAVLAAAVGLTYVVMTPDRQAYARRFARAAAGAIACATVLSSYWIVPFVAGRGVEARVVGATGPGELNAYAAVPDSALGLVPNLLGLYGFWAENSGRFTPMKAFVPGWPVALAVILAVAAFGAVHALRRREGQLAPWAAGLVVAAAIALVLEVGVSSPLTEPLVRWLDSTVPLYRGMRDAGKWAALLALVYSQLLGIGTAALLEWVQRLKPPAGDWLGAATAGLLLALALFYGNGLLFGMHGEIRPSAYPAGWYAADHKLAADSHPGRTLFLPWHEYMGYSFIGNQNKIVASPAPQFFSVPILSSADPEVAGVAAPGDPDQTAVAALVRQGQGAPWASVLAARGVKYVLLAKEADWEAYAYLRSEGGLALVGDYGSIEVFRNVVAP